MAAINTLPVREGFGDKKTGEIVKGVSAFTCGEDGSLEFTFKLSGAVETRAYTVGSAGEISDLTPWKQVKVVTGTFSFA